MVVSVLNKYLFISLAVILQYCTDWQQFAHNSVHESSTMQAVRNKARDKQKPRDKSWKPNGTSTKTTFSKLAFELIIGSLVMTKNGVVT